MLVLSQGRRIVDVLVVSMRDSLVEVYGSQRVRLRCRDSALGSRMSDRRHGHDVHRARRSDRAEFAHVRPAESDADRDEHVCDAGDLWPAVAPGVVQDRADAEGDDEEESPESSRGARSG